MHPHIPHAQLTPEAVPAVDAPWPDVSAFGHTFHAYRVAGSVPRVRDLAVADHARYEADGTLPDDLTRLRLDLFATVRAVGVDEEPDPATEAWARALLAAIADQVA